MIKSIFIQCQLEYSVLNTACITKVRTASPWLPVPATNRPNARPDAEDSA